MIPLLAFLPPWWKLAAAGVVAVALAGSHWKVYTMGKQGEQRKAVALQLEQTTELAKFNENQRHLERANGALIAKAQNDRAIKIKAAQPVVVSLNAELGGLSSDIYTLNTDSSGQPASACKTAAVTARAVFEQCAKRYSEVAGAAQGHDADSVMFEASWPK